MSPYLMLTSTMSFQVGRVYRERIYARRAESHDNIRCDCHRRVIVGPYVISARHDAAGHLTVKRECRT